MADPQIIDFPNRQPYRGEVIGREDPRGPNGARRVKVKLEGVWDQGNWCVMGGGSYDDSELPPLGAEVAIFFYGGNAENPYCLPGHLVPSDVSSASTIASDAEAAAGEGDNKVYEDKRIRVERDARNDRYAIRISDAANDVKDGSGNPVLFIDIDLQGGQVGINGPLGLELRSDTGSIRIQAPQVEINGRKVMKTGKPI